MALPPRKPGSLRDGSSPGGDPSVPETGKEKFASERLGDRISELEEELEEIKVKYEMFFLGAERMEPARRRDDLKREVARLLTAFTRNAGLRFRIQALHARFLSYERLWMRTAREKEAGTYRRDLVRARRKGAVAAPGATAPGVTTPAASARARDLPAEAASASPTPARPASEPSGPGPVDAEIRALYDAYVAAKRSCNEDTSRLSLESLARTVSKQGPGIAAKYGVKRVEFKVAVRDGRAVLTAVPKD